MLPLPSALLGVIDSLSSSRLSAIAEEYRQAILSNSAALDTLGKSTRGVMSENERATTACQICTLIIPSAVVAAGAESYVEALEHNWSLTCWLPAAAFLKLANTVEVSLALKVITHTQVPFAVRSGGHTGNPGFASIGSSGIVLDLSKMNSISLSPDQHLVSVGPSAKWGGIYKRLEKDGLTAVGGRISDVPVAGLITGGGMSHYSNHWGFPCDNVENFEIVLANSTVVDANVEHNTELFRAVKGGSLNFGIVTRFDLCTHSEYRQWYSINAYSTDDIEKVLQAFVIVQDAMDTDDRIGSFTVMTSDSIIVGLLYRDSPAPPTIFGVFDDISPIAAVLPGTVGTQSSLADALFTAFGFDIKKRRAHGTLTTRVDVNLYLEMHRLLVTTANNLPITLSLLLQPLGPAAMKKSLDGGGNLMNISPVPQSWIGILANWEEDTDDELSHAKLEEFITSLSGAAERRGLFLPFQFMNDASSSQSPLKSYGPASFATFQTIAQDYDPDGVFQHLQNSGFLLSRA